MKSDVANTNNENLKLKEKPVRKEYKGNEGEDKNLRIIKLNGIFLIIYYLRPRKDNDTFRKNFDRTSFPSRAA